MRHKPESRFTKSVGWAISAISALVLTACNSEETAQEPAFLGTDISQFIDVPKPLDPVYAQGGYLFKKNGKYVLEGCFKDVDNPSKINTILGMAPRGLEGGKSYIGAAVFSSTSKDIFMIDLKDTKRLNKDQLHRPPGDKYFNEALQREVICTAELPETIAWPPHTENQLVQARRVSDNRITLIQGPLNETSRSADPRKPFDIITDVPDVGPVNAPLLTLG